MNNNARNLYDTAEKYGIAETIKPYRNNIRVSIPYSTDFCKKHIDELGLSVRSRNGLMRAGIDSIEKLISTIMSENSLSKIRNLGRKSVNEIKTALLFQTYECLNSREKMHFWEIFSENNRMRE